MTFVQIFNMEIILTALIAITVTYLLTRWFFTKQLHKEFQRATIAESQVKLLSSKEFELEQSRNKISELISTISRQEEQLQSAQEKQKELKTEVEQIGEKFQKEFRLMAQSILEEKSERFVKLNEEKISGIISPFKEELGLLKKKVEETYDRESKERFSLGEKVQDLVKASMIMSQETSNLTQALKGDTKTQGDWGEMILESVLEHSGLVKDREYFIQEYIRDSNENVIKDEYGVGLRPDAQILYPDKRCLIIDSKVSLTAYERFAHAQERELQEAELKAHVYSLRCHIDELHAKNYQHYVPSLDWIIMFVPIEPAYLVALRHDQSLWNYAYRKKIIMVSPTNLLAVLKITSELWKREYQTQNTLEIARRGGALYDKFAGFIETMEGLGASLGSAQESFDKAFGQLSKGRGNLVSKAEQLRELGIKTNKRLSEGVVKEAMEID